ncbi:MAG: ABC transporter ATP-binding protein [Anaerolineales bacterium]
MISPFRYLASTLRPARQDEILWALKDVSFQVAHGEVLGIVGRNGAGKSTLLKILSRITEPTEGGATIYGRIGSLLEVGTGFHPELTGRENIYLSGAILGMRRAEIDRKFDEIVAFAEVQRFLDTQVKRYSSGMYVRLAFAVAAHLDPEILIIDEVLAVGDAAFQKKCLGKMGDVATAGRTVVFVSHNMVAIQNLCQRALWLDDGKILDAGQPSEVVSNYLSAANESMVHREWPDISTAPGNDRVKIRAVRVRPEDGELADQLTMDSPVNVEVEFWNLDPGATLLLGWRFFTQNQAIAFTSSSGEFAADFAGEPMQSGLYRGTCHVPANLLNEGGYELRLYVYQDRGKVLFRMDEALVFDIINTGERPGYRYSREPGAVRPLLSWDTTKIGELE